MAPYANELWRFCFISEEEQPGQDDQAHHVELAEQPEARFCRLGIDRLVGSRCTQLCTPGLDPQRPQEQSGKRRPDDHGNGYLRAREGVRAKTAFRPAQL
jgi:hypothetical protein